MLDQRADELREIALFGTLAPHLDGHYTIVGRVAEGIDVVDAVTELEIDTYGRYGPPGRPYPQSARITALRVAPPS